MDADVASFLAQRKERKKGPGKAKFKTFTASVYLNNSSSGGGGAGAGGEADFRAQEAAEAEDPLAPVPLTSNVSSGPSPVASGSSGGGGANAQQQTVATTSAPTAATLVAGEWIDDDSQFNAQPRLANGNQVADLETMAEMDDKRSLEVKIQQEDTRKQFHALRLNAREAQERPSDAPTASAQQQQQQSAQAAAPKAYRPPSMRDRLMAGGAGGAAVPSPTSEKSFPSLGAGKTAPAGAAATTSKPVASVWGKVDHEALQRQQRQQQQQQQEQLAAAAAAAEEEEPAPVPTRRPNAAAETASSSPSSRPPQAAASPAAVSAPPPRSSAEEFEGLKRSEQAWKPRSRREQ